MTYHYDTHNDEITLTPTDTEPITNDIYNAIIKEALTLGIDPPHIYMRSDETLHISHDRIHIAFHPTHIAYVKTSFDSMPAHILYEQYTTLAELLKV